MRLNRKDPLIALLMEIGFYEEIHHPQPGQGPLENLILAKAANSAKKLVETPSYSPEFVVARAALHKIAELTGQLEDQAKGVLENGGAGLQALIRIGWPEGTPEKARLLEEAAEAAGYMQEGPSRARDWVVARAAVHDIAMRGPQTRVPVERIECVDWSQGHEQPADPLWRIELGGYCADFPSEQAALNFASQIEALIPRPSRQARAVLAIVAGDTEAPEAIRPLSWLQEAVRELKERGPAPDCDDREAYRTMVQEVYDLHAALAAALKTGG